MAACETTTRRSIDTAARRVMNDFAPMHEANQRFVGVVVGDSKTAGQDGQGRYRLPEAVVSAS